jgi:drug/metabolite transporter (DMT)-like permease
VEVLLGGLSSLLYGVADFLGGQAARRVSAASVVVWAGVVSLPVLTVVALVVGGDADPSDFLIGAAAGACGALGLVALFAGLSRGSAAVVAPLSAALSAAFPVVVGVAGGEQPTTLAWIGLALALPAIALCSWVADPHGVRAEGLLFGTAAGLGFGGFAVVIRLTDPASNLLPLIASRGATMTVVLAVGLLGIWQVVGWRRIPAPLVVANGLFDVAGNVTLLLALRAGSLALAAVAASFYPAVTVAMARVIGHEHLRKRQIVGLGLTVLSVGLIAA